MYISLGIAHKIWVPPILVSFSQHITMLCRRDDVFECLHTLLGFRLVLVMKLNQ